MVASLMAALEEGESHTTEFKETTKLLREAAQTIVAFANAHGGDLFFGVTNNRDVKGIDDSPVAHERLAADLDRFIYPYAPVAIDPVPAFNGKTVVRVSVPADSPPVVGAYLYSSRPLPPDERVSVEHLRAYRRVGRMNRQVPDFMWLRPQSRTDPLMLIDQNSQTRGEAFPKQVGGVAWMIEGSGIAHAIRVRTEPELAPPREGIRKLPSSDSNPSVSFSFDLQTPSEPIDGFSIVVEYQDDWGCLWESRRWMAVRDGSIYPASTMSRRIVEFPSKRATA